MVSLKIDGGDKEVNFRMPNKKGQMQGIGTLVMGLVIASIMGGIGLVLWNGVYPAVNAGLTSNGPGLGSTSGAAGTLLDRVQLILAALLVVGIVVALAAIGMGAGRQ